MASGTVSEFLEIVRKNLGASDVRIMNEGEAPPASEAAVACELPFGRLLVVSYDAPPADAQGARNRLEMLVRAFSSTLAVALDPKEMAPKAAALARELAALVERAGAIDAFVIDAHSPAIWGGTSPSLPEIVEEEPASEPDNVVRIDGRPSTRPSELALQAWQIGVRACETLAADPRIMELVPREICEKYRLLPLFEMGSGLLVSMADPTNLEAIYEVALHTGLEVEPALASERLIHFMLAWNRPGDSRSAAAPEGEARVVFARAVRDRWMRYFAARRSIQMVRRLPELSTLHRGGHLNRTVVEPGTSYIARSFAAIYVLLLVFPGPFDELRAKAAIAHSLAAIESLVLSLPPRDPSPSLAGAQAMRRRRPR